MVPCCGTPVWSISGRSGGPCPCGMVPGPIDPGVLFIPSGGMKRPSVEFPGNAGGIEPCSTAPGVLFMPPEGGIRFSVAFAGISFPCVDTVDWVSVTSLPASFDIQPAQKTAKSPMHIRVSSFFMVIGLMFFQERASSPSPGKHTPVGFICSSFLALELVSGMRAITLPSVPR